MSNADVVAPVIARVGTDVVADTVGGLGMPKTADGLGPLDEVRLRLLVLKSVAGEVADLLHGVGQDGGR